MSLPPKWLLGLLGQDDASARGLAHEARDAERDERDQHLLADERRFVTAMEQVAREPHVVLGTTGAGVEYRVSLRDLTLPGWITAGTGAGKSRLMGALVSQLMRAIANGAPLSVIEIDGKGEGADQQLRTVANIAQGLPAAQRVAFLSRVHTASFFSNEYLPSWPMLAPVPGVPILAQADAFADILIDAANDSSVGGRQRPALAAVTAVCLENNIPVAAWPWVLASTATVATLGGRSSIPSVRLELSRFEREARGSIDGLVARLATVLRVPTLKAALSGSTPFDAARCFEPGSITTVSFGGADLGSRNAVRAMGSLVVSAITNAAFDPRRRVRGTTVIVVDEPQSFSTSSTLAAFERLVTLGRSFGAGGLFLVHQGAPQLSTELQTVMGTNAAIRVLGRSAERDAAAASEWLPRTGRVPRPRESAGRRTEPAFLSETQEERHWIAEVGRLPARNFLVADRRATFQPRVVRAPAHDPPEWAAIDPAIAAAVRRGSMGVPRNELEERVRLIEERAARDLEGERVTRGRDRTQAPETPDVVGRRRRGRRGEMP